MGFTRSTPRSIAVILNLIQRTVPANRLELPSHLPIFFEEKSVHACQIGLVRIGYRKAIFTVTFLGDLKITSDSNTGVTFNMAIAMHLFYFVQEWRKAVGDFESGQTQWSCSSHAHGIGTEITLLNERYKDLSGEQGFSIKEIGVKSTTEVAG